MGPRTLASSSRSFGPRRLIETTLPSLAHEHQRGHADDPVVVGHGVAHAGRLLIVAEEGLPGDLVFLEEAFEILAVGCRN